MTPRFFYFDLGNVLLHFDHQRACRQVAELVGVAPEVVWDAVFDSGMELRYEAGEITSQEFYEFFCERTQTRPDFAALAHAASDIFGVNHGTKAILAQLLFSRRRLGLLSNTNEMHWSHIADGRYGLIPEAFETVVLSYQVKAIKPDPKIFRIATDQAGVAPQEIFYVDDIQSHVTAAQSAGWDAVQFTTPAALAQDLRHRGIELNY